MSHRDHRDEHEGCKVVFPWLRWCSKYRYVTPMVQQALQDIESMHEDTLQSWFRQYQSGHEVWKGRSDARAKYIRHLEGWDEKERDGIVFSVDYIVETLGNAHTYFEGRTREQEIERQIFNKRQITAIQFLYAYGMFDMRTGKIKMSNLEKLK